MSPSSHSESKVLVYRNTAEDLGIGARMPVWYLYFSTFADIEFFLSCYDLIYAHYYWIMEIRLPTLSTFEITFSNAYLLKNLRHILILYILKAKRVNPCK